MSWSIILSEKPSEIKRSLKWFEENILGLPPQNEKESYK